MTDAPELDRIFADCRTALLGWLLEHPVLSGDGKPMMWSDGRPVALDVANALHALGLLLDRDVTLSQADVDALRRASVMRYT